ncbi:MAG: barstar family protein [Bdellovibrionaceae bacterium]|nr:barstar family protein [Pseudobdellovibrionaceae bacterium]
MKKLTLHLLLIALVMVSTFAAQSAQTPRPPSAPTAAPLASANKQKKSFEFTCETTEDEFYDWITKAIWKKPSFGRNLDAAFDALTSDPDWTIRVTESPCADNAMNDGRRESLYLMIEDAHSEGFGFILYGY